MSGFECNTNCDDSRATNSERSTQRYETSKTDKEKLELPQQSTGNQETTSPNNIEELSSRKNQVSSPPSRSETPTQSWLQFGYEIASSAVLPVNIYREGLTFSSFIADCSAITLLASVIVSVIPASTCAALFFAARVPTISKITLRGIDEALTGLSLGTAIGELAVFREQDSSLAEQTLGWGLVVGGILGLMGGRWVGRKTIEDMDRESPSMGPHNLSDELIPLAATGQQAIVEPQQFLKQFMVGHSNTDPTPNISAKAIEEAALKLAHSPNINKIDTSDICDELNIKVEEFHKVYKRLSHLGTQIEKSLTLQERIKFTDSVGANLHRIYTVTEEYKKRYGIHPSINIIANLTHFDRAHISRNRKKYSYLHDNVLTQSEHNTERIIVTAWNLTTEHALPSAAVLADILKVSKPYIYRHIGKDILDDILKIKQDKLRHNGNGSNQQKIEPASTFKKLQLLYSAQHNTIHHRISPKYKYQLNTQARYTPKIQPLQKRL